MNIRISYVCFILLAILSVRAWVQSREANSALQELRETAMSSIPTGAPEAEFRNELNRLNSQVEDLFQYNQLTTDINTRITRVTLSFMLLGAICYILEERKIKKGA